MFNIGSNHKQVQQQLKSIEKQLRFATVNALTQTAKKVKQDLRESLPRYLDRPTNYTLNALAMIPATLSKPTATVYVKSNKSGKPHYLEAQVYGGARPFKTSELRVKTKGFSPNFIEPSSAVSLNQYGNIPKRDLVKMLSSVNSQNAGAKGRGRGQRSKARGVGYFIATGADSRTLHLEAGLYRRQPSGEIKPMLIFSHHANYRKRWPFFAIGMRSVNATLVIASERAIQQAIDSAKV